MLRFFKIRGDSLVPEYSQGDFVLVSKIPLLVSAPSPGMVIAFRQPGYGLLIKRIESITDNGGLSVIGTHPESIDSRTFGLVQRENVIGKVIWHIRKT